MQLAALAPGTSWLDSLSYLRLGCEFLVVNYPRIVVVGPTNPGDFNGIFVGVGLVHSKNWGELTHKNDERGMKHQGVMRRFWTHFLG